MIGQITLLFIGIVVLATLLMTPQILFKLEQWAEREYKKKK